MRVASRSLLVCVLGCLVGSFGLSPVAAFAEERVVPEASSSSLSGSPLVVPSAEPLVGGQQAAAEEAARESPEAVSQREASATAYEGLEAGAAERLANADFGPFVDDPAGGPPSLPVGQRITGFVNAHAASVDFGAGSEQQGAIESVAPMALESPSGSWLPVDLALHEASGGFEPARPLVGVRLPKHVGEGARLPSLGLSVTPVDSQGGPAGDPEGVLDGAGLFFANALTDTDLVVKPSIGGLIMDALLRSVRSPEALSFRVGLPEGASMDQLGEGAGPVEIRDAGKVMETIAIPRAVDAEGTSVPVKIKVSGDLLTLTLAHPRGRFRFPIAVDPEFNTTTENWPIGSWRYEQAGGYSLMTGGPEMVHEGTFPASDWAEAIMTTKGDSKIYKVSVTDGLWPYRETEGHQYTTWLDSWFEIIKVGVESHQKWVSGNPLLRSAEVCAAEGCSPAGGAQANNANFVVTTLESSSEVLAKYGEYNPQFGALFEPTKYISQPKETHSTVSYNTASREIEYTSGGKPAKAANLLYNSNVQPWFGPYSGAFEFKSQDVGLGVSGTAVEVLKGTSWEQFLPKNYLVEEGACIGVQCAAEQHQVVTWSMLGSHLVNGYDKIRVSAHDPMSATSSSEHGEGEATVKVDTVPPHGITLSGLAVKEGEYELGEVPGHVKVEATDGEGSVPSSGIQSLTLAVDGKEVGKPGGFCYLGPCSTSAEWSINGGELGAGSHTFTVAATDIAGNVATREFILNVHPASPVAMGPGSVNPESGDFALETADVEMSGGMGSLAVTRHYDSRNPQEGAEGPLGPQWTISLGSLASLEVLPDGSVMVIGPEGLTHFSKKTGGGFEAPVGDTSLTLEFANNEYLLKNPSKKTTTRFTLPSGAKAWMPTVSEGPVATDTTTDAYATAEPEAGKKIVEPTLEVSPHPNATCAVKKLERGCRALEFNYAESTTATGENQSEWGDYKGHLTRVYFIAYDPATKAMRETAVAQYAYDKQGRLRAEWDPRISPALKKIYGYDAEGHVTALTPPGQQTMAFAYGQLAGDEHSGRLLKVTRSPASATLWGGSAPLSTAAPVLSGGAFVGMRLSVSTGTWGNNPVVYGYRWEDCNGECSVIPGAVNANYTVSSKDTGRMIVAQVIAANGGGSVVASSEYSAVVGYGGEGSPPTYAGEFAWLHNYPEDAATDTAGNVWVADTQGSVIDEFSPDGTLVQTLGSYGSGNGQFERPRGVTIDSAGNVWVSDGRTNRIQEFTSYGAFVRAFGSTGSGNGQLSNPEGLAVDSAGNVWVADNGNNRIEEFSSEGAFVRTVGSSGSGNGQLSHPGDVAIDAYGDLWATDTGNNRLEEFTSSGSFVRTAGSGQLSGPKRLKFGPHEGLIWVADTGDYRVAVFSTSGEYMYQFTNGGFYNAPMGVAVSGPDAYVLGTEGRLEKWWMSGTYEKEGSPPTYSSQFGSAGSGTGQFNDPWDTTTDSAGNVWVADTWNNRIEEFSSTGAFIRQFGSLGTGNGQFKNPYGIAVDTAKNVWVADTSNDRIEEFTSEGTFVRAFGTEGSGNGQLKYPEGLTVKEGNVWVVDKNNDRIEEFTSTGSFEGTVGSYGTGNGQLYNPGGIAVDSKGNLWVADTWKYRIEEFSSTGAFIRAVGSNGTASGQFKEPKRLTAGPENDVWVSDTGNNRVQVFSPTGEYKYQFGTAGSGNEQFNTPTGITIHGENVYVTDSSNNRVEKWLIKSNGGDGELRPAQLGSTIEYGVPLATTGLPTMTEKEAKKWAQKDIPTQAMAIFPPDEPQKWPASDYKRATVYYLDAKSRTVNVASPSGAVSTTEYNGNNDVERTLSPANRVTALKEGCESKEKCKSAEVAKLLDTESVYGAEGTQLTETLGPQHTVKIVKGNEKVPSGSEVLARNHLKYYYDENAPTTGETYDLVTKTTAGSETTSKEEFDARASTTSYSGEENLGWKLRMPTSTTTDPSGLKLTHSTVYDPETGSVIESRQGTGASVPTYASQFGADRGGHGKFNWPEGVAVDGKGNVWVADTYNNRVQEFSASGEYLSQFGSWGTGNGQMEYPKSVAVDGKGNVWIVDSGANRVEEFSEAGAYIAKFGSEGTGNGQFKSPEGLVLDSKGNVWVVDSGNNRVQEFTEAGVYVKQFGSEGTGNGQFKAPRRIAVDSKANVWVSDGTNCRVQEFNEKGEYLAQFGSYGSGNGQFSEPQGVVIDASGNIWVADESNDRVQEFNGKGEYLTMFGSLGSGNGQLKQEEGLALDSKGSVWVSDSGNSRVEEFSAAGAYMQKFGSYGTPLGALEGPSGVAVDAKGNAWVADTYNARIMEFSPSGESLASVGTSGTGVGQLKQPAGITVDSKGNVWVVDQANNRVEEYDETGKYLQEFGSTGSGNGQLSQPRGLALDKQGNVWVADTANNRIEEFGPTGAYISKFGIAGHENGQLQEPTNVAIDANGNLWIANTWNGRIDEFSQTGKYIGQIGTYGTEPGQLRQPLGIAIDQAGNMWVADASNNRVQEFNTKGQYLAQYGTAGSGNGQFKEPHGIALDGKGNALIADTWNERIQKWTIATPHASQTIYYSAEANPAIPGCGLHPEWIGLPCIVQPALQPSATGPSLPVTTYSYNIWNEPETVTETFPATEKLPSTTRTKKTTFDAAGRGVTSEVTSTNDAAAPVVTNHYDTKTGALVKQVGVLSGKEKTITSTFNTLGQLESYTDAEGGISKYEYDIDGRTTKMTVYTPGLEERGKQTYTYDTTTGFLTKLVDSPAGTFTANYDVAGHMTSETYPNKMTAFYTRNAAGETTGLEYKKEAHCATTCPEVWFNDAVMSSVHGETVKQTSSLAEEPKYAYDAAGRLTEVQEIPAGKGCKTRVYAYDEESNRTSLTSREPGSEGKCATEGGSTETHTYDAANRLTGAGVAYEAFGNTTKLPGADAGGPEMEVTTSYYVDNQVASQAQNGKTFNYAMDPAGRVRETETIIGGKGSSTVSHYSAPGAALSWTSEPESKWTRDIPGIDGTLSATQSSSGMVTLQLHDLQGNVVDTAADNETETKVLTSYNSTEFGAPLNGPPPTKYSWLGAAGVSSEQPSGLVTQDGVTYVPQTGRPLQTQGTALPTPDNAATAYVSTIEAGIEASTAAASAQQVANAEQARIALELANQPPGSVPAPGGEEGGGGGGGCSGTNACAASLSAPEGTMDYREYGNSYMACEVWASWGAHGLLAELTVYGHGVCVESEDVPKFQLQIALLIEIGGKYQMVGSPATESWTEVSGEVSFHHTWACPYTGGPYLAWVFGRQYGRRGHAQWWASGIERRTNECRDPLGDSGPPPVPVPPKD
jgi:YD repeat-containing protein